jgi:hypothetical protein
MRPPSLIATAAIPAFLDSPVWLVFFFLEARRDAMRKWLWGLMIAMTQVPIAVPAAELHIKAVASSGGTTVIHGTATGSSRLTIEGASSLGGKTVITGRADDVSPFLIAEDSPRSESLVEVRGSAHGCSGSTCSGSHSAARSLSRSCGGAVRGTATAQAYAAACNTGYRRGLQCGCSAVNSCSGRTYSGRSCFGSHGGYSSAHAAASVHGGGGQAQAHATSRVTH